MIRSASSRGRMVSVRLSEEEFRLLRKSYALTGARSLSELARTAMLQAVQQEQDARWEQVPAELSRLNARIAKLEKDFDLLCVRLAPQRSS